jgi:hypothetical protein
MIILEITKQEKKEIQEGLALLYGKIAKEMVKKRGFKHTYKVVGFKEAQRNERINAEVKAELTEKSIEVMDLINKVNEAKESKENFVY